MPSLFSARRAPTRPTPMGTGRRLRLAVPPLAGGLLIGVMTQLILPSPVFRAVAVVAPEAGGARNTADMRQLADFALSRPVLRAAAARLVGRNEASPLPGPLERLGLIRIDSEQDRVARLADQLGAASHVAPSGDALMIGAQDGEPTRAARVAQALADAFLVKRAEATAGAQRTREAELAARIAAAEATAGTARKRFLAAGGADAGVEKARAAAAAEIRDAEARIARIRSVMVSGAPPVVDDATASQAIGDLQANYLDLQGKLAEALQTLGERHTTVITLRDSIRRTASELSAAWTRQLHAAEADRDAAKARDAALFRNDPGRDAGKQAALEEARRVKEAADAFLLRAEAELDFLPDQPVFVLRSAALAPARAADGWSPVARAIAAFAAGLATFLALLAPRLALAGLLSSRALGRRSRRRIFDLQGSASHEPPRRRTAEYEPVVPALNAANDSPAYVALPALTIPMASGLAAPPPDAGAVVGASPDASQSVWAAPLRAGPALDAPPSIAPQGPAQQTMTPPVEAEDSALPMRFFRAAGISGPSAIPPDAPSASASARVAIEQLAAIVDRRPSSAPKGEIEALRALDSAFSGLVDELRSVVPASGPIPTLMVAATQDAVDGLGGSGAAPTDVALAIGEVAAAAGLRVLLVEASRQRALLAGHAVSERRPTLVGMRDGLRLVFAADAIAGVFLAPLFGRRAELIAALSRHRDAPLVDDIEAHYDLLIVDGGDAATAARAGWTADRYLCVGTETTVAAGARFLSIFGHLSGRFAGTVSDATFVPPPEAGARIPTDAEATLSQAALSAAAA